MNMNHHGYLILQNEISPIGNTRLVINLRIESGIHFKVAPVLSGNVKIPPVKAAEVGE